MSTNKSNNTNSNKSKTNGGRDAQHAWEDVSSDAKWANVEEDEEGNIVTSTASMMGLQQKDVCRLVRDRKRRLERQDYAQSKKRVVRDMMRYLYLVLDASRWMQAPVEGRGKLSYMEMVWQMAANFIKEFYDVNPLSHLGIIVCQDGEADMLTQLSIHPTTHLLSMAAFLQSYLENSNADCGEFSLQNGLEVAGRSLGHVPSHASREILVLCAALNTCDPGNVLVETLPKLKSANIRVTCLALSAEMHVCRNMATATNGIMSVAMDPNHLHDLWMQQCIPPPTHRHTPTNNNNNTNNSNKDILCRMVPMGFPMRIIEDVPCWIHTTNKNSTQLARTSYSCPRCKAKVQTVPTDCHVCGLALILAPHLARSYHHLFPVPPFTDLPEHTDISSTSSSSMLPSSSNDTTATPNLVASSSRLTPISSTSSSALPIVSSSCSQKVEMDATLVTSYKDCDRCCFGCLKWIGLRNTDNEDDNNNNNKQNKKQQQKNKQSSNNNANEPELLRFQCPNCRNVFCADCDAFLHESLHNCPGCLCI